MMPTRVISATLIFACALALISLTSCGPSAPRGDAPSEDAQAYIVDAQADMDAGRLADAERKLQASLRLDDRSAQAHYLLGNVYARQEQHDKAEQSYLRALEIDATYIDARANLGVVLYQQHRFDRAREAFEAVLSEQPDDATVHYNLGGVLAAQNELDKAIEHFYRATVLDPQIAEPYLGLGSVYQLQGKNAQAIAAFKQYLQRAEDPVWRQQAEQMIRDMGGTP
jgi:Tfp pilus assembly protein PilF